MVASQPQPRLVVLVTNHKSDIMDIVDVRASVPSISFEFISLARCTLVRRTCEQRHLHVTLRTTLPPYGIMICIPVDYFQRPKFKAYIKQLQHSIIQSKQQITKIAYLT